MIPARDKATGRIAVTHGLSYDNRYFAWQMMMTRCYSKKCERYPRYGGRGIRVCPRWKNLKNFLSDMGPKPPGTTLGRIDNNGNYEPGNCRWETVEQQVRNRSNNRLVTFRGETMPVVVWAERFRIDAQIIYKRLDRLHWSPERAVSTPPRTLKRNE